MFGQNPKAGSAICPYCCGTTYLTCKEQNERFWINKFIWDAAALANRNMPFGADK